MRLRGNDAAEHAYLVAYDISDAKRWRQTFRTMKGYGERLQLSVWHCRLSGSRRVELAMALEAIIDDGEDCVAIIDLGNAQDVAPKVETLGRDAFQPIERRANIV